MVEIWCKLSDYEIHICGPSASSIALFPRACTPFSRGAVSWSNGRANKVGALLLSWAWSPSLVCSIVTPVSFWACLVDMTLSIYTTRSSSPPGKVSVWSKLSSVLPPLLHVEPVLVTQLVDSNQVACLGGQLECRSYWSWASQAAE